MPIKSNQAKWRCKTENRGQSKWQRIAAELNKIERREYDQNGSVDGEGGW